MEKIITIGDKEVKLSNNVVWAMEYRDQFGTDIVPALMPLIASALEGLAAIVSENPDASITGALSAIEGRAMDVLIPAMQTELSSVVVNVVWAMAKAADESIEPPKKWVRQFDTFPLDVIIPEVGELALKGFVSSKNLERLRTLKESLKGMQPSISMTSSSQDSKED